MSPALVALMVLGFACQWASDGGGASLCAAWAALQSAAAAGDVRVAAAALLGTFTLHPPLGAGSVTHLLSASAAGLAAGEHWRLLSYAAAHGSALHLGANAAAAAVLCAGLRRPLGGARTAAAFAIGVAGGALMHASHYAASGGWRSGIPDGTIGASAGVCGLIGARVAFELLEWLRCWVKAARAARQMRLSKERGAGDGNSKGGAGPLLDALLAAGVGAAARAGGENDALRGGVVAASPALAAALRARCAHRAALVEQAANLGGIALLGALAPAAWAVDGAAHAGGVAAGAAYAGACISLSLAVGALRKAPGGRRMLR